MTAAFQPGPYTLTPIADTSERFGDFRPYVASINNNGVVAFQAALKGGGTGVYTGEGEAITDILETTTGSLLEIISHPDVKSDGSVCFYASRRSGGNGVFVMRGDDTIPVAENCGPLGPTMNDAGVVAYRAVTATHGEAICTGNGSTMAAIVATGVVYSGFQGLPVINSHGDVAFRADLTSGGQGIYIGGGGRVTPIVETGETFGKLGLFPIVNDEGAVAFVAERRDGASGVFVASRGTMTPIIESAGPFESFRGVLINNAGRLVVMATPRGGAIGVYTGPNPATDCLLSVGAPLLGSDVAEFALNPVSINDRGQLAIRVMLSDARQLILRADPAGV